jgi:2-amino-4-hydroxy-6-hydroxymethyldihydropteridine diphosphokinase
MPDRPIPAYRDTLKSVQTAYIGLGANLASPVGPPAETLAAALGNLESLGHITARSSLYSTDPVGFADQPRFVNAVIALQTDWEPRLLLKKLLEIEKKFGRDRSRGIPNGPRTLDLDILLVEDLAISEPGLELPHPRLADREFVLIPLSEIAPQLRIPGSGKTVLELVHALRKRKKGETDAVVRMESDRWRLAPQS